jgi:hypothetical protein
MHENGTKFHKKLKGAKMGDIQLHDICTEFHKNQSGFAYCTDVNNYLVGCSLLKRLGQRNLQIQGVSGK